MKLEVMNYFDIIDQVSKSWKLNIILISSQIQRNHFHFITRAKRERGKYRMGFYRIEIAKILRSSILIFFRAYSNEIDECLVYRL